MKVMFVAVFTDNYSSTNDSQADAFEAIGCDLIKYNYRIKATELGSLDKRDNDLIQTCLLESPDLVVFSKCNKVDIRVIHECNKFSKTCLWFMDAYIPNHWNAELVEKVKHSTFVCCDKKQSVEAGLKN